MHTMPPTPKSLRVLMELRPALGGHAGIPQATRLLFRNLSSLEDMRIEGLIQSGDRVLKSGLPARRAELFGAMPVDQQLNRLGRVVIAIEQGTRYSPAYATVHTILMAI